MREMPEAKLVVVQAFNKEWEAEMAKSALKAAGIDAMIQADSVGGNRSDVAFHTGGYKVLVRERMRLQHMRCSSRRRSAHKRDQFSACQVKFRPVMPMV